MNGDLNIEAPFPRVAVIGCGAWGKNLVRNFAELGALAAVCDTDLQNSTALATQYNVRALSEANVITDPAIDAVIISSLAPLHANQAETALGAGKHVYIEKPMALSVRDAKRLCDLAKEKNRILYGWAYS